MKIEYIELRDNEVRHFFNVASRSTPDAMRLMISATDGTTFKLVAWPSNNAHPSLYPALAELKFLTSLTWRHPSKLDAEHFYNAIRGMKALRHLDLSDNSWSTSQVKQVCKAISFFSQLEFLDLSDNQIAPEGARVLAAVLAQRTTLTGLKLDTCQLKNAGLAILLPAIAQLTELRSLSLSGNQLSGYSEDALTADQLASLAGLRNLESLDLSHNNFEKVHLNALSFLLPKLTKLRSLNLKQNGLFMSEVVQLTQTLPALSELTELNLSWTQVDIETVTALAAALSKMPKLTSLELCRCNFSAAHMKALCNGLSALQDLELLDLSDNKFSSEGAQSLAPVIASMKKLRVLKLGGCALDGTAMSHLAPAIEQLPELETLELEGTLQSTYEDNDIIITTCTIGDEGATLLANALKKTTKLRTLNLQSQNLSVSAIHTLAPVMTGLTQLSKLTMSLDNSRPDAATEQLMHDALRANTVLSTLVWPLSNNKLTPSKIVSRNNSLATAAEYLSHLDHLLATDIRHQVARGTHEHESFDVDTIIIALNSLKQFLEDKYTLYAIKESLTRLKNEWLLRAVKFLMCCDAPEVNEKNQMRAIALTVWSHMDPQCDLYERAKEPLLQSNVELAHVQSVPTNLEDVATLIMVAREQALTIQAIYRQKMAAVSAVASTNDDDDVVEADADVDDESESASVAEPDIDQQRVETVKKWTDHAGKQSIYLERSYGKFAADGSLHDRVNAIFQNMLTPRGPTRLMQLLYGRRDMDIAQNIVAALKADNADVEKIILDGLDTHFARYITLRDNSCARRLMYCLHLCAQEKASAHTNAPPLAAAR